MSLLLFLSEDKSVRLHVRLMAALKDAIVSSHLAPGSLLPSSRDLAQSLGISRCTVSKAYEELARTGYIITRAGGKTHVATVLPESKPLGKRVIATRSDKIGDVLSAYARRLEVIGINATWGLSISAPPRWLLPIQQWKQLQSKYFSNLDANRGDAHPFGELSLRAAIAGYLSRSKGISCQPEQVITFLESESALSYLCQWLIDEGDLVVVEEPCYVNARNQFLAHGAEVLAIPVDEQGLDVDELKSKIPAGRKIKIIYVTPTFHDPSGVCMSLARRQELLQFAREHKAAVVEDSFEGNYCFIKGVPPPLYRLSDDDNVFHISSFWKILFPLSAAGFVVIPERFVPVFERAKRISQEPSPAIEKTLEEFIETGLLEKHLKWVIRTLTSRRQDVIEKLINEFGQSVRIRKQSSAFWLTVQFDQSLNTEIIHARASACGLILQDTERYYAEPAGARRNEFLIPFALDD